MDSRIREDVTKLFEFWCEITPTKKEDGTTNYITESFPESFKDDKMLSDIQQFAFPCEVENSTVQVYSFVLTGGESNWRFGYCRNDPNTKNVMLILTYLPMDDTFRKFIKILADIKKSSYEEFRKFLSDAYYSKVPNRGGSLKLLYDNGINNFTFDRPVNFQLPELLTNHNLSIYYSIVEPKNMIAIFAAMLAERRIIFTSKNLDRLSACVQAANSFLYPMVWQHIFIPILPMKLREYLQAPMPFLIGAPKSVLCTVTGIENTVIFDCDTKILTTTNNDVENMPYELVHQLKKHLNNQSEHEGDRVSRIFLGVLVQLIGNYRDAVRYENDKIVWDRETFIDSRPVALRPFLRSMFDLQMFQQFIDERLEILKTGKLTSDEFELETMKYFDKMGKKKHFMGYLKNVKEKTNPAMKSAVKSVKQSSRGVKTAYKDLKSKLKDTNSPPKFHTNHDNGHHSAPTSPVSTRKFQAESSYRKPTHSQVVQSSSQLWNGLNGFNHNNNVSKSPTLSPPSSNSCSISDMNILPELQEYAFFKTPAVDRSLKPSNSYEYHPTRPPRSAGGTQTCLRTKSPTQVVVGNLLVDSSNISGSSSSQSSNSFFDVTPDIPSPPVPPPRTNYTQKINSTSTPVKNNFISNNNLLSLRENVVALPIVPKKSLLEEQSQDLIKLETDSSFEIEDFDPLNKNAKPLPITKSQLDGGNSGISNPLYPHFSPTYLNQQKNTRSQDDMSQLWSEYGLDKFGGPNEIQNGSCMETTQGSSDRANWTKFD